TGKGRQALFHAHSTKVSLIVAAFIAKLYAMVEDDKYQSLIHWNGTGGFVVPNPDEFAKEVLPQYFKHNNFASFVRQLNMYGFHKGTASVHAMPASSAGGASSPSPSSVAAPAPAEASNNSSGLQNWEFAHSMFRPGRRDHLPDIRRKVPLRSYGPSP